MTIEVDFSALSAALKVLQASLERFPEIHEALFDCLFDGGNLRRDILGDFRNVSASGARGMTIALELSNRFREILAAATAGQVDRLRSYRLVQVHGGPRAK